MATTAQRRQRKQVSYLVTTARENRRKFHYEWNKRVVSWLCEINRRGALLRACDEEAAGVERVFEVVDQADRLIAACGAEVDRLVGPETRQVLIGECCKIAARVYGPAMYRIVNHRWYGRVKELARHRSNFTIDTSSHLLRDE